MGYQMDQGKDNHTHSIHGGTYILILCQTQDHISSQNDAGKPVIMEEYGVSAELRASVYPSWQKTVEDGDLAADAFWQLAVPCNPDLDEFALCSSDDDFKTIIGEHASAMASKVSIYASADQLTSIDLLYTL